MFENLADVLVWLAVGGGSVAIAGAVMALLLENLGFWQGLPTWVKTIVPIIIAGFIGVGAQALIALDITAFVPPWMGSLLLVLINWLVGQWQYISLKSEARYGLG